MKAKSTLTLLLFASGLVLPQAINFGLQFEAFRMYVHAVEREGYTNKFISEADFIKQSYIPNSVYLKLGYDSEKLFALDFTGGYILADDYTGLELGAIVRIYFPGNLYLIADYFHHWNDSDFHNTGGAMPVQYNFIGSGVGYKLTNVTFLELYFSLPLEDKKFGWSQTGYVPGSYSSYKPKSIIKFGIGFNWEIAR